VYLIACSNDVLGDGVVGKAPIMSICTYRNSGGVNSVSVAAALSVISRLNSMGKWAEP